MIRTTTCINVYSDMNPWIDFCIVINAFQDFTEAEEVVQEAYDSWFESDTDEAIADYISRALEEKDIDHEMYFNDDEEEEN